MKSADARVAELILRAQTSSDGGKNCPYIPTEGRSVRDYCAGYNVKDKFISLAINMIAKGNTNWKYAVIRDTDRVADYIVYFQTRIDGEKVQISFHSFDSGMEKYIKRSFRIKWDCGSSRKSAISAYYFYCPNGQYV